MSTGAALLAQLRQQRAAPAAKAATVPSTSSDTTSVPDQPADEWTTDADGRCRRIRAPRFAIAGFGSGQAGSSLSDSNEVDSTLQIANRASEATGRANAAADELVSASIHVHANSNMREGEEQGWAIVKEHNDGNACWVVIGSRVLDATKYLGLHPGGSVVIERLAGRDATQAYKAARHSHAADMKLHDFDIGAITDLKRLRRAAAQAAEHRQRLAAAQQYLLD